MLYRALIFYTQVTCLCPLAVYEVGSAWIRGRN